MSKSVFRPIDEQFGLVQDERTVQVQAIGNRNGFWLTAVFLTIFAFFQQVYNGQPAPFWFIGTAVLLALGFLFWRRQQIGESLADERGMMLMMSSYRTANFIVLGAAVLWLLWLPVQLGGFAGLNGLAGFFWWPLALLLPVPPILLAHTGSRVYRLRLAMIVVMIFTVGFLFGRLLAFFIHG